MNELKLQELVHEGKSIQDLATLFNKSKTSIRYWLTKYNLTTTGSSGNKPVDIIDNKKRCGCCDSMLPLTSFGTRSDRGGNPRTYCISCESMRVLAHERKLKDTAIAYMGGKCVYCNIVGDRRIYDFHHLAPEHKDFNIGRAKSLSFTKIIKELDKCILLCANCHKAEHHLIKSKIGYDNKIKGNTESWQENKQAKLDFINKHKCDCCGYDKYNGSLGVILDVLDKHHTKNNTRIWSVEYKTALLRAQVLCLNCVRLNPP